MQKHIQHNKDDRTQFFRKNIPLTLFERVRKGYKKYYLWEVSWRLSRTVTYWPHQHFWLQQHFFPVLLGCSTGGLGTQPLVLIPASSLQLIGTSCRRGYIIIWCPPTFCKRHNSYSIQPVHCHGYTVISSNGCTCYLHRCISHLTATPGRRSICDTNNFLLRLLGMPVISEY